MLSGQSPVEAIAGGLIPGGGGVTGKYGGMLLRKYGSKVLQKYLGKFLGMYGKKLLGECGKTQKFLRNQQ
jgi:hypothetical protein